MITEITLATILLIYIGLMYLKKRRISRLKRTIKYKLKRSHELESTIYLNDFMLTVNELYAYLNDRYRHDKIIDPLLRKVS